MNDLVKSLVAVTILSMLGGFAVAVTNKVVHAPSAGPATVEIAPLPVRASASPADSAVRRESVRHVSSVKEAQ
jgi:hypothetical protein